MESKLKIQRDILGMTSSSTLLGHNFITKLVSPLHRNFLSIAEAIIETDTNG